MSDVNNPKGLHKFVGISPPVADLIMVDCMQPLAQQALPKKQAWTSATLKQDGAPFLVDTADQCAGIEGYPLENIALPTHSLTVGQNSGLSASFKVLILQAANKTPYHYMCSHSSCHH